MSSQHIPAVRQTPPHASARARGRIHLVLLLLLAFAAAAFAWSDASAQEAQETTTTDAQGQTRTAAATDIGAIDLPEVDIGQVGGEDISVPLQILLLMTALTLLPAILLGLTAFTRVIIVLGLLRQALGTGQTPSNQVLVGLGLFLTAMIMTPVGERAWSEGLAPYFQGQIDFNTAWQLAFAPFREFMLAQIRETDLLTFAGMTGSSGYASPDDVPFGVLIAAFITSELKTAFEIGFLIFIPFVVIDLVVSSVLMSMGMMMLSPMLVSAPFKILLFVLVDGWVLIVGTLAASFN
ncbi:flagellar type III secretion system pore protein FliP [Coralloluteibacterium stylophorae]|uniref:Flagellar biosynthetic protein FliP n=1 Tax=Coralloluteibacterium stylophorae TaxID=1776034 RepID=A0A8J8AYZ8_9GAMM|nr:flagellar type III secretion system pore protein FliP [Coralloluteibacterium stylophorae]